MLFPLQSNGLSAAGGPLINQDKIAQCQYSKQARNPDCIGFPRNHVKSNLGIEKVDPDAAAEVVVTRNLGLRRAGTASVNRQQRVKVGPTGAYGQDSAEAGWYSLNQTSGV